jgi:signal peptidase I
MAEDNRTTNPNNQADDPTGNSRGQSGYSQSEKSQSENSQAVSNLISDPNTGPSGASQVSAAPANVAAGALAAAVVEAKHESSFPRELRGWVRDLAVALSLALIIIVFLYQPVKVEGTSMAPLLSDQERIFINKFVYRFEPIERGDVVVFWYPLDRSKSFIKRVVGLPGETIELRRGKLFIDGKSIGEPYVPASFFDGGSYGPLTVPPTSYFVMGDHRDSSNDSRMFGPVSREYIYGKAVFAYWPVDHFGSIYPSELGAGSSAADGPDAK